STPRLLQHSKLPATWWRAQQICTSWPSVLPQRTLTTVQSGCRDTQHVLRAAPPVAAPLRWPKGRSILRWVLIPVDQFRYRQAIAAYTGYDLPQAAGPEPESRGCPGLEIPPGCSREILHNSRWSTPSSPASLLRSTQPNDSGSAAPPSCSRRWTRIPSRSD